MVKYNNSKTRYNEKNREHINQLKRESYQRNKDKETVRRAERKKQITAGANAWYKKTNG